MLKHSNLNADKVVRLFFATYLFSVSQFLSSTNILCPFDGFASHVVFVLFMFGSVDGFETGVQWVFNTHSLYGLPLHYVAYILRHCTLIANHSRTLTPDTKQMRSKDHRNIETVKDWVSQTNVSQILVEMQMQRCERDTHSPRDNFSTFHVAQSPNILMALLGAHTTNENGKWLDSDTMKKGLLIPIG